MTEPFSEVKRNHEYPNGDVYPYRPENWGKVLPLDRLGILEARRAVSEELDGRPLNPGTDPRLFFRS